MRNSDIEIDLDITVYFHNLLWTLCIHLTPLELSVKMIDIFLMFNFKIFLKCFYVILVENKE